MTNDISLRTLKNAELMLRFAMIVTMLVAGVSKFCSHGTFHDYYLSQFSNGQLRIQLPYTLFDFYLMIIPFVEVAIGLGLIWSKQRRIFIVCWVFYFISLEVGHYILEEWMAVDAMIPFILLGVAAYILPGYQNFKEYKEKSNLLL